MSPVTNIQLIDDDAENENEVEAKKFGLLQSNLLCNNESFRRAINANGDLARHGRTISSDFEPK